MPQPTLQQQLDEAIAARHAIVVGKRAARITMGERTVEYSEANLASLNAYIASLQAQLSGNPARGRNRIRRVVFD